MIVVTQTYLLIFEMSQTIFNLYNNSNNIETYLLVRDLIKQLTKIATGSMSFLSFIQLSLVAFRATKYLKPHTAFITGNGSLSAFAKH